MLVAAGSSVGLGNIWRFPYLVGEGGGAAFIIVYLLAVIFIGHPIVLGEFVIGRSSRKNIFGATAQHGKGWSLLGVNSVLIAFLIPCFYLVVAGWTLKYVVSSASGAFVGFTTAAEYEGLFTSFVSGCWIPIICTLLFAVINYVVIAMGVQKGIERVSKFLMPTLFVLLVILAITSLTMPNSIEGLKYLFVPDFSKLTPRVVLDAIGQVFFSLSIGHGCLATYASYFSDELDLRKTARQLAFVDTGVALLAAVIILPAVFSVGIEPSAGPSLVFITLPSIFNSLPFSTLISTLFFALLFIAALTSTLSMYEVVTAFLSEEFHLSRRKAMAINSIGVAAFAVLSSLSFGLLSEVRIFGGSIFDLFSDLTAQILLPIGGILTSLYAAWALDEKLVRGQLNCYGERVSPSVSFTLFMLKYICPATIFVIFLDGLGVLRIF